MAHENELIEVIEDYCKDLPDRLASLFDLVRYSHYSTAKPVDVVRNIHDEVHRMAGAAQCMGFRDLGRDLTKLETKLAKGMTTRRYEIEDVLKETTEKLVGISNMLPDIVPANSRVLQIVNEEGIRQSLIREFENEPDVFEFLAGLRILLADDDEYVRSSIAATLKECGAGEIRSVNSGLEVLKAIREFRPDVIITDWHMKPVTGLELLQCIRKNGTELPADTPVIFFSSESDQTNYMQASCEGASRFLRKPVSPATLVRTLKQTVETWRGSEAA